MSDLPQLAPGLSFLDHTVNGTRYIYSAYPVLTLTTAAQSSGLSDCVTIDRALHHVIYADGVKITGVLDFKPGRKVTIVARTLDAEPGLKNEPAEISVNGDHGAVASPNAKAGNGGEGTNGPDAVRGGAFSNGSPAGNGNPGDRGADGVDGHDGTDAGEIRIFAQNVTSNARLALTALGGNGSPGQVGGDGGPGGNGGHGAHYTAAVRHVEHYFIPPADGGRGGDAGYGGRGGLGGHGGAIVCHVPAGVAAGVISVKNDAGKTEEDAAPGAVGQGGMRPEFLTDGGRKVPAREARTAARQSSGDIRKRTPPNAARPPAKKGAVDQAPLTPAAFADVIHPTHCMMMLQRAKAAYTTASVATYEQYKVSKTKPAEPAPVTEWGAILDWLSALLILIGKDTKLQTQSVLNRPAFADLLDTVRPLKSHADLNQDIYGKYANQVATSMLTYSAFDDLLKRRIGHLDNLADAYTTLSEKLKTKVGVADALQVGIVQAGARRSAIETHVGELIQGLVGMRNEIDVATSAVSASRQAVLDRSGDFKVDIKRFHFDLSDFLSALTMVAFSPPGISEMTKTAAGVMEGGDIHGTPMAIIQTADFIHKASTQIKTDSGIAVSQDYLIRKVNVMTGQFTGANFLRAYEDFRGHLGDPTSADTEKILVSIEEYERLVDDYLSMDTAVKLDAALRGLTAAIQQRNGMLLTYNATIDRILQLQEEMSSLSETRTASLAALAKQDDPELPRVVAYLSLQYANALEGAIQEVHDANKAYAYWSLDTKYNVFREVLATRKIQWSVRAVESITPRVLVDCHAALQRRFWEKIKTSPEPQHIPADLDTDSHKILITDENVLAVFREQKEVSIQIDAFSSQPRPGVFSDRLAKDLHDLRLLSVRVFLNGVALVDRGKDAILKLEVTHGVEDVFYDANRTPVTFRHQTNKRFNFEYRPATPRYDGVRLSGAFIVAPIEIAGPLTEEAVHKRDTVTYAGFGPFTTWTIKLSDETPILDGPLENIEIQFLFLYRKI